MIEKSLVEQAVSLAMAITTGEVVDEETVKKRLSVCQGCPLVEVTGHAEKRVLRCGICGCRIKGDKSLFNLARYKETNSYGCKHPSGSRWKAAGL